MIRAAAESRPVEEVARLTTLLYLPPLEPHCGDEAVRTAATHRPVEEVVELALRLARGRAGLTAAPASAPQGEEPRAGAPAGPELPPRAPEPVPAPPSARPANGFAAVVPWTAWTAALALTLCGVAHVPVRPDGIPAAVHGVVLVSTGLCVLPALLAVRRPALWLFALAAPLPAAFAGAHLLAPRTDVARLSRVTEAALAPPWLAAPTAVAALVTVLLALFAGLARLQGDRRPAARDGAPAGTAVTPHPYD